MLTHSLCILATNPPPTKHLLLFPFQLAERCSQLPKVTQLPSGLTGI